MTTKRAVARFRFEGNAFSPLATGAAAFRARERANAALAAARVDGVRLPLRSRRRRHRLFGNAGGGSGAASGAAWNCAANRNIL
jgi:microcystin degradation protein MlrC